ncbi:MAG: 50S ribosomal protein L29 [Armatimonadetes bacterium]|nr:50S ribosomal protein L29 [Armatimonadota bacterium]
MKKREYKDLLDKPTEDLEQQLYDSRAELFNLRYQKALNQLQNVSAIRTTRKDIARLEFLLSERKRNA